MRSIACRRMVQLAASLAPPGASFETPRVARLLRTRAAWELPSQFGFARKPLKWPDSRKKEAWNSLPLALNFLPNDLDFPSPGFANPSTHFALGRLPRASLGRAKQGVDDAHVGDCVFDREFERRLAQNRAREGVALQRVLIADGELLDATPAAEEIDAGIDDDFRRPIRGPVERDDDLDAPRFADYRHPLMRGQLGRDAEGRMAPPGELENRARQPIGSKIRIAVEGRNHARRLRGENVSRRQDGVAADVVNPAAARRPIAHILRVEQAIGEKRLDRAGFADRSCPSKFSRAPPLRMVTHHEGFGDDLAGAISRLDQRARFLSVEPDRLLTQHVLAGLQRAN